MKFSASLFVQGLLLTTGLATAFDASANTTTITNSNTTDLIARRTSTEAGVICDPFLWAWYYNNREDGPYDCTTKNDNRHWSMLNAYRSGGTQNVHWKYTNYINDGSCLYGWTYYSSDGNKVIEHVPARTTMAGDTKRWCALKVYRQGGVRGKQWDYCPCQDA